MTLKSPSEEKHACPHFAPNNTSLLVSLLFSVPNLCSSLWVEVVSQKKQVTCEIEDTSAEGSTDQAQFHFAKENSFCGVTVIVFSGSKCVPCI